MADAPKIFKFITAGDIEEINKALWTKHQTTHPLRVKPTASPLYVAPGQYVVFTDDAMHVCDTEEETKTLLLGKTRG